MAGDGHRPSHASDYQQVPPPGPMLGSPAGLGPRVLARLLDAVLVFVPAGLILQILGFPSPVVPLGGVDAWTWSAVTAIVWFAYYVGLEAGSGATVGKRVMRIRVVGEDGRRPGAAAVVKRNLWMLLGLVPWVGGVAQLLAIVLLSVTIASGEGDRGKHDELAGTAVTG